MKRFISIIIFMWYMSSAGVSAENLCTPSSNRPYTVSITPLDVVSVVTNQSGQIGVSGQSRAHISLTYYNTLGYPVENVAVHSTPSGKSLFSLTQYEGMELPVEQWLPLPRSSSGLYVSPGTLTSQIATYYSDSLPYSSLSYEKSALHRVVSATQSGADYNGHSATTAYTLNASNEVMYFKVNDNGGLVRSNYYAKGTLYKTVAADEDGKQQTVYTDKLGRTILTRKAGNADTYYVYNQMGQLAFVLPPLASEGMSNGTYPLSNDKLKKYAYCYKYDSHGNCKYKRLPGCEPVNMVYDKAGRLVMSQSGKYNLAHNGEWLVCKYDTLNRLAYTYQLWLNNTCYNAEDLAEIWNAMSATEVYSPGSGSGTMFADTHYSLSWSPSCGQSNNLHLVHIVNYYDDYSFLNHHTALKDSLSYDSTKTASVWGTRASSAMGRLTGQRVYQLDDDNNYSLTVFYYDKDGNVLQCRSSNHLGGYDLETTAYSFSGLPIKKELTHSTRTSSAVFTYAKELYTYNYDHAGRLVSTTYKIDNNAPVQLQSFVYDEFGRLRRKNLYGGLDSILYSYNIRNKLTRIKSKSFEENLYYNTIRPINGGSQAVCYNGNISAATYTFGTHVNGYDYYYDSMNRLYGCYGILDGEWDDYPMSEWFTYDKNGNIKYLARYDHEEVFDNLEYIYEGNQVKSISNTGMPPVSYDTKQYQDLENYPNEFYYDNDGNLIIDLDRHICNIEYNMLNLPNKIFFCNGNCIQHTYNASGTRLQTTYYTRKATAVNPINFYIDPEDYLGDYTVSRSAWSDNVEYYPLTQGCWKIYNVFVPDGYIRDYSSGEYMYNYYIKDHLGNVRETYITDGSTWTLCNQRVQYYPSGLPQCGAFNRSEHPYLYNGKEFIEMHGLDEYDSHARWYYPAICRTTTMDPLCEKYYDTSPYAWCGNNPVNVVDLNGDSIQIEGKDKEIMTDILKSIFGDKAEDFIYTDNDMLIYKGDNSGLKKKQKDVLEVFLQILDNSTVTEIIFGEEYVKDENNKVSTFNYGGALVLLAKENDWLQKNVIVVDPNITSILINEVTSAYYITPIDPDNGPRFIKKQIKSNIADAVFHEVGHVIFQGQSQDKVILFNNKVRKILKLKPRPFDEEHNINVK